MMMMPNDNENNLEKVLMYVCALHTPICILNMAYMVERQRTEEGTLGNSESLLRYVYEKTEELLQSVGLLVLELLFATG